MTGLSISENVKYQQAKADAFCAGKLIFGVADTFIETIAMVLESSQAISGGRAAEIFEYIEVLLKCRAKCEQTGLMRDILLGGHCKG